MIRKPGKQPSAQDPPNGAIGQREVLANSFGLSPQNASRTAKKRGYASTREMIESAGYEYAGKFGNSPYWIAPETDP